MLTVDKFGEYLRVAGYADGSDWWVLLPHHAHLGFGPGVAGPEHVWHGEGDGRLHILHAPSRRESATVQLEGVPEWAARWMPVLASRDGRRLYCLHWLG